MLATVIILALGVRIIIVSSAREENFQLGSLSSWAHYPVGFKEVMLATIIILTSDARIIIVSLAREGIFQLPPMVP